MATGDITDGTSNTIRLDEAEDSDDGSPFPNPGEPPPRLERAEGDGEGDDDSSELGLITPEEEAPPGEADFEDLREVIDRLDPGPDAADEPPPGSESEIPPDSPAAETQPPDAPEAEADAPDLFEPLPAYGTGADGPAPAAGNGEPTTAPTDDPGLDVLEVPAADYEPETNDPTNEPIDVNATDGDGRDVGLLDQVADAVSDLWGDATDVVT